MRMLLLPVMALAAMVGATSDSPTVSPTASPTISPTVSPTASPTMSPSECEATDPDCYVPDAGELVEKFKRFGRDKVATFYLAGPLSVLLVIVIIVSVKCQACACCCRRCHAHEDPKERGKHANKWHPAAWHAIDFFNFPLFILGTFNFVTDVAFYEISLKEPEFEARFEGAGGGIGHAEAIQHGALTCLVFAGIIWAWTLWLTIYTPETDPNSEHYYWGGQFVEGVVAVGAFAFEQVPMMTMQIIYVKTFGGDIFAEPQNTMAIVTLTITGLSVLAGFVQVYLLVQVYRHPEQKTEAKGVIASIVATKRLSRRLSSSVAEQVPSTVFDAEAKENPVFDTSAAPGV